MQSGYELTHWIKLHPKLVAYEVTGLCVFPIYASSGCITPRNVAFLAKSAADFPRDAPFDITPGLSDDGKTYTLLFNGWGKYEQAEVDAMLADAEEALA